MLASSTEGLVIIKKKMKTIKVRVTFTLPVEIPDDEDYDANFDIEENHCPGTGRVGNAIEAHIKKHDGLNMCWGCAVEGTCKII